MTAIKRALEAKEKGNELFKAGKISQSVKFYTEAEGLDPTNPVYPANLSAAQYEKGEYVDCIAAILRSWSRRPEKGQAAKLTTRLAKALCQAGQNGALSAAFLKETEDSIEDIRNNGKEVLGDHAENDIAWSTWTRINADIPYKEQLAHEAKVRLLRFPIARGTPDPHYLTYHTFGMDEYIDLMREHGPEGYAPITIQDLSPEQLAELSFLVGGVGDGRHSFGTLIGLDIEAAKLTPSKRAALQGHITLLDIHPYVIARNLLMLMMVHALAYDALDEIDRIELQATLVYLFIGWVMPSYCDRRTLAVINDLLERLSESPLQLPSWLHLDVSSVKPVTEALKFWANARHKKTATTLEYLTHIDPDDKFRMMGGIPGMNLEGLGPPSLGSLNKNGKYKLSGEVKFFEVARAFIPPSKLWPRHEGQAFSSDCAKGTLTSIRLKKLSKEVLASWRPNITIFYPPMKEDYLSMELDAFAPVRLAADFNKAHGLAQKDSELMKNSPVMGHMLAFFDAVVNAVRSLGDQFHCELIAGEINLEMSKVRLGTDTRPKFFPKTWTRIWLSNIPDYTHGTLNTAMLILPVLQSASDAAVSSNCLWNSPVWKTDDQFCYNYTLLLAEDLPKYLGIRVIRNEAVMKLLTLGTSPLPRPLGALASRDELRDWLTRIWLGFIWPGLTQARPNNVRIPNNVAAFVRLLVQLHNIGYPSHWLAEFLQSILQDIFVANRNIRHDVLPRPVSDLYDTVAPHKTRMDPFEPELEAILASALQGLPFALQMPPGWATDARDIGHYKVEVDVMEFPFMKPIEIDPVVSLIFYTRSWRAPDGHRAMLRLPKVVDGATDPPPGTFYVYSAPLHVNLMKPGSEVEWMMSKARVQKMRAEGWGMVCYRGDTCINATMGVPARDWVEMV